MSKKTVRVRDALYVHPETRGWYVDSAGRIESVHPLPTYVSALAVGRPSDLRHLVAPGQWETTLCGETAPPYGWFIHAGGQDERRVCIDCQMATMKVMLKGWA